MKKFITALLVGFTALLILMPACSSAPATTIQGNTITVTDDIGREVQVPENPQRIAALYSFAGYAVCLLGGGDDLVAVPAGLKRDILLIDMFPALADASTPREGGTINVEELLRIKPDLVIVRNDTVVDGKEKEKLDKTGIPYIVVDFYTMKEQQQSFLMIGKAIGRDAEAKAYDAYYTTVIDRVTSVTDTIPQNEKIRLYHSENQATRTDATNSLASDWTKAAGVIDVSVGEDLQEQDNDYYASIEQILIWDPQVIIANEPTAYALILGHPQWSGVQAVRDGKVYQLPNGISRWGHPGSVETPLALLWTAKIVYPERFTDLSMEDEVKYYYKTFFNLNLDDEMVATILKGGDLREPK